MISARERRESRTILRGMATTVSNGHMVFDGVAPHHEDDTGEWFEGNFKPSDSATTTSNVKHCPFAIWLFTPDGKKVFQDKHNDNACTLTDVDVTDKDDTKKKDSHHHAH